MIEETQVAGTRVTIEREIQTDDFVRHIGRDVAVGDVIAKPGRCSRLRT